MFIRSGENMVMGPIGLSLLIFAKQKATRYRKSGNETTPCCPLAPAVNSLDMQPVVFGLHWVRGPECQLLDESGARGDRAGALPIGEAHLYHHGQGLEDILESNPTCLLFQPLRVTEGDVVHYIDNKSFAYKIIVCTFAADNRNV